MFIIVKWHGNYEGVAVVTDEDGLLKTFKNKDIAEIWAEDNCQANYKIVEI